MNQPRIAPSRDPSVDRIRALVMADALGRLLDRVRGSRQVLLHLAALERGLAEHGLESISRASERTLMRVCAQLGSLPLSDDDPALHDLLDRVSHALEVRHARPHGDLPHDMERSVLVAEVSHGAYLEAERDQASTVREPRL